MLQSISWTEFLTAIIGAIGAYYIIVLVLYYRSEIIGLSTKKNSSNPTPLPPSDSLMGKIKQQPQQPPAETISSEEIKFQPSQEPNTNSNSPDTLLIGTIADLLQDIKTLSEIVQSTPKDEVVPLFKSLLSRYPSIIGTNYQQAISLHLYTTLNDLGFTIDTSEPSTWWPQNQ